MILKIDRKEAIETLLEWDEDDNLDEVTLNNMSNEELAAQLNDYQIKYKSGDMYTVI